MVPEALEVAEANAPPQVDEFWPDVLAPRLGSFMAYIERCGAADGPTARLADFDLLHVPDLIAHLTLIDPVGTDNGRTRFWFRFVGTWHLLTFGQDVTGKFIDELYNDPLATRSENVLHGILATGQPHYWRRASVFHDRKFLYYQRIVAPLADEAGRVVRLVGCYDTASA